MPFVNRPGASIHYVTRGAPGEPAVVLLQGLGLSSRFWFDIPDMLAKEEGRSRRVIAVDNRGTGKSGRPRPPWTMGTMADDVAAVLDDAGVNDVIVVGISMGGMIAQHVALRHPSRVRGLVLLATTPGFLAGALPAPTSLYRLLSVPLAGRNAQAKMARLLLPRSKWARAAEILRDWPSAMREDPTSPATFAGHLFAASTHFVAPRLSRIACPALVVAGTEDMLIPRRNAEVLARGIPRAELELLPDTGHAIFADDRDLVRRLVVRLEQRLAGGTTDGSAVVPPMSPMRKVG